MPDFRPSQEDLLGYLLGALDAPEQVRVGLYVKSHPEVQAEIERLRNCLRPLSAADVPAEPPGGLARRTCQCIFSEVDHLVEARRAASAEPFIPDAWRVWDLTMMMAVVVMFAMLAMPAIYQSRETARRLACASNLRNLSYSLSSYSDLHSGSFPAVPTSGPAAVAGAYSMVLKSASLMPSDAFVVCPASEPLAFESPFSIPLEQDLCVLDVASLRETQRRLGGSYGYHIGQLIDGVLVAARDRGRNDFAILSDAPEHLRGLGIMATHPKNGRNVLYESGRVCYLLPIHAPVNGLEDPFHNRQCRLAPGTDESDSVLCESGVNIADLLRLMIESN